MTVKTHYVESATEFSDAIARCRQRPVVAVDTEFARFNTYYPIVGLIQLYAGEDCYLLDPLAVDDLSPLADLLGDSDIVKVLHSGSEDMEVFQTCLGMVPVNMFDSQIAAAILGVGFSMSYQALVSHYLDIAISKEETRSDWLQRPLTASQLDYAALDVVHLLAVYQIQSAELERRGRLDWVSEESAQLAQDLPIMVPAADAYLKGKGLNGLNRRQLAVVRALYAWREGVARERDMPRNRVLDPKAIAQIARLPGIDSNALGNVDTLSHRQLKRYGDTLVAVCATVDELDEASFPEPLANKKSVDSKLLKTLRSAADEVARAHDVSAEILVKRRDLEAIIRSAQTGTAAMPDSLEGWRAEILGSTLIEALHS